jgi:sirohydrochlorin ferrochelatase
VTPDSDATPEANAQYAPLPARRRRTRPGGRHRGADSFAVPSDAPPLVLAVPGPGPSGKAREFAALTEAAHPGLRVRLAHLDELTAVLTDVTAGAAADEVAAVLGPLTTGPIPAFDTAVRAAAGVVRAVIAPAEPLGPHPLIAQALHARLAEAGLARADRIRLLTMHTTTDGVVVCVVGGAAAVRDAEVTCVLLASRLAVPVVPVAVDGEEGPAAVGMAVDRLRAAGAGQVAVSPAVIGPELPGIALSEAAAEFKAELAAPLGTHPALIQLVAERYADALERAWAVLEG